jgi:hypothetical protein
VLDPFLLAHRAGARQFNLAGKLSPVSIRDQMVRARMFVDRAFAEKLIGAGAERGLCVLGGGAAGVTAAIRASELGVEALLLEKSGHLFSCQRDCSSRWIDPTQYDWPLDHWSQGQFPWGVGAKMPLPWVSGRADHVASLWRNRFGKAHRVSMGTAPIDWRLNSTVRKAHCSDRAPSIEAEVVSGSKVEHRKFGAVLVTVGFGKEITWARPSYQGFAFWDTDPLEEPNWGSSASEPPRILISGSGDGALQDFLRVMTRLPSARAIAERLNTPGRMSFADELAAAFKDPERRSAQAFHWWGRYPGHDHTLHESLDQYHLGIVRGLLAHSNMVGPSTVRQALKDVLANRPRGVKLVHRCNHLTPTYSLNRFLTLLIAEYLRDEFSEQVLEPNCSVTEVQGTSGHTCAKDPWDCHGRKHAVQFARWDHCAALAGGAALPPDNFDIVILRHGIDPGPDPFDDLTPLAQSRQVLPFYVP